MKKKVIFFIIILSIFISPSIIFGASVKYFSSNVNILATNSPFQIVAETPTPTSKIKLTSTITTSPNQTQTGTQLNSTSSELISHFEKVSSSTLDIAKWVLVVVGTIGGVSGGYAFYTSASHQKKMAEIKKLDKKITKVSEIANLAEYKINQLNYMIETRNLNPQVRKRAIQKLSQVNDLSVLGILIDTLKNETEPEIIIEIVYSLYELIKKGNETDVINAIDSLSNCLDDNNENVVIGTLNTFNLIFLNKDDHPHIRILDRIKLKIESLKSNDNQKISELAEKIHSFQSTNTGT